MDDEKGVLALGNLSYKYIDDPDLRGILANAELDASKMKSFAESDILLLITSIIYSEKFELKGKRMHQVNTQFYLWFIRYYLDWEKDMMELFSLEKFQSDHLKLMPLNNVVPSKPTLFPNSKEKRLPSIQKR